MNPRRLARPIGLTLGAILTLSAHAGADWSPVPPFDLTSASGVLDAGTRRLIRLGLAPTGTGPLQGDRVQVLDLVNDSLWLDRTPSGAAPSASNPHATVLDSRQRRILVIQSDRVWTLGLDGAPLWSQFVPSGRPADLSRSTAVYDSASERVFLYGGTSDTVSTLALGGTPAWSRFVPPNPPAPRWDHSAILDPLRRRMIIHGGRDAARRYDDIWALSLDGAPAWTRIVPQAVDPPYRRYGHAAIYDPFDDRMIVFSGTVDYWPQSDGVWELRLGTPTPEWNNMGVYGVSGTYPRQRVFPMSGLDFVGRRMIVAGGPSYTGQDVEAFALQLDGPLAWSRISREDMSRRRTDPGIAMDPLRRELLETCGNIYANSNDTWRLKLGARPEWQRVGDAPQPRQYPSLFFDARRSRYLLYGGYGACGGGCWPGEVLALNPAESNPVWRAQPGWNPPGRQFHAAALDAAGDRLLVYGGYWYAGGRDDSLWAWSLDGSGWRSLGSGGAGPGLRELSVAIVDARRGRFLLYGGTQVPYGSNTDLWSFDLATSAWALLPTSGTPPSLATQAIYDPLRDRMLVSWGGTVYPLDLGTLTWGSIGSGPSESGYVAYDPLEDALLLRGTNTWRTALGPRPDYSPGCSPDRVWQSGDSISVGFHLANPCAFAQPVDWTLTSERNWPGYPRSGTSPVPAGGGDVAVMAPVPDTAAAGLNTLRLRALPRLTPVWQECSMHIHDSSTATHVTLVSAEATADRVHLRWFAEEIASARLERREIVGGWAAIATLTPDGAGYLDWEDRDVVPGARYGYRLASGAWTSAETWVDVPAAGALSLAPAGAHPASGALWARVQLPAAGRARLDVLDVGGRRVRAHELWAEAPGVRTERVDGGRALAPGVYVMRLTFAGRTVSARAVVLR